MKLMTMALASVALATQAVAGTSATVPLVYMKSGASTLWSTVPAKTVSLPLAFPAGATKAVLTVQSLVSGVQSVTLPAGTATYDWQAFGGDTPAQDDLCTLALTYYNGTQALKTETARLAVLRGSFGATRVKSDASARSWQRFKGNAVIPSSLLWSNAGTGDFTFAATSLAGGTAYQDVASAETGWFAFGSSVADAGQYHLTLARSGADTLSADVQLVPTGLLFIAH